MLVKALIMFYYNIEVKLYFTDLNLSTKIHTPNTDYAFKVQLNRWRVKRNVKNIKTNFPFFFFLMSFLCDFDFRDNSDASSSLQLNYLGENYDAFTRWSRHGKCLAVKRIKWKISRLVFTVNSAYVPVNIKGYTEPNWKSVPCVRQKSMTEGNAIIIIVSA